LFSVISVRFIEENTKLVEKETGNKSNNDVTTTKKKALQDIIINNGVGLINSWVDSMRACSPTHLKSLLKQSSWLVRLYIIH
jgi:trehalose 6-phosphate phosphatase